MSWTRAIGPWNAGPQVDIGQATSFSVTWKRSDSGSATFDLAHWAQGFGQVVPLTTDVWLFHDGTTEFRGRAGGHAGTISPSAASKSHSFADYREVLNRRALIGPHFKWTDTDPGDAAWQVIVDEQARPASDLSITRGVHPVTLIPIDALAIEVAKSPKETLDNLAALVHAGAEWDVTPVGLTGLHLDWWDAGGRGVDRSVTIDLGGIAVSASDTADTTNYANGIRVSGQANNANSQTTSALASTTFAFVSVADGSGFVKGQMIQIDREVLLVTSVSGNTMTVTRGYAGSTAATHASGASVASVAPGAYRQDVSGIASRPEGRWDVVESTSEVTDTNLQNYAAKSLAAHQITPVTWTAELRRGWWQGRSHLFVGDPFRFICKVPVYDPDTDEFVRMAYDVDETMRVEQITAAFDEQAEPKVSITFGAPPKGARWKARQIDSRLAALERR